MDEDIRGLRRKCWENSKSNIENEKFKSKSGDDFASSISKNATVSNAEKKTESAVRVKFSDVIDLTCDNDELVSSSTISSSFSKKSIKVKHMTPTQKSSSIVTSTDHIDTVPIELRVATYNIWFGPPYQKERMIEIASILTSKIHPSPLFIGLQEVTQALSQTLFPLLRHAGYEVHEQKNVAYGCAIAIKTIPSTKTTTLNACSTTILPSHCEIIQIGFLPYTQTIMERGLLWVHAKVMSRTKRTKPILDILFTTTHLESFVRNYPTPGQTYNGCKERENQIHEASQYCENFITRYKGDLAIITGDLNWDDERKRSKNIPNSKLMNVIEKGRNDERRWKDAWLEGVESKNIGVNDVAEGYTYDSKTNPMLKGNLRRRFDRCLYHVRKTDTVNVDDFENDKNSSKINVTLESVSMFGKNIIQGLTYRKHTPRWGRPDLITVSELPLMPSDHYGLLTVLKLDFNEFSLGTAKEIKEIKSSHVRLKQKRFKTH